MLALIRALLCRHRQRHTCHDADAMPPYDADTLMPLMPLFRRCHASMIRYAIRHYATPYRHALPLHAIRQPLRYAATPGATMLMLPLR